MKPDVDLYDSHYGAVGEDIYVAVRREAFGEDLGQASWITEPEARHFWPRRGDFRVIRSWHGSLELCVDDGCALEWPFRTRGGEASVRIGE